MFIAFGSEDEKENEKIVTTESVAAQITAIKLCQEYDANEVAADENYKGRVIEVTGSINDIKKDVLDKMYVSLEGCSFLEDVQCYFSENQTSALTKLKKEQKITVRGKCEGLFGTIRMKGCIIVD